MGECALDQTKRALVIRISIMDDADLMCKKNFAYVCLATFRFLFYCVPHQERTRLQIYTQIYRITFRKIKRPIFLSFLEPSRGSYNDDDQTIIAIQAGLKSVDRSMQYLRS